MGQVYWHTSRDLVSWSSFARSCCWRCLSATILCLSSCCQQVNELADEAVVVIITNNNYIC